MLQSLRSPSIAFVTGVALTTVTLFGAAQKSAPASVKWEYAIYDDVTAKQLEKLNAEGWEYVGYLGQGMRSSDNDETLWRRQGK